MQTVLTSLADIRDTSVGVWHYSMRGLLKNVFLVVAVVCMIDLNGVSTENQKSPQFDWNSPKHPGGGGFGGGGAWIKKIVDFSHFFVTFFNLQATLKWVFLLYNTKWTYLIHIILFAKWKTPQYMCVVVARMQNEILIPLTDLTTHNPPY